MLKSETIGELAKALASAQGMIQNAKKDSENPFFKSKYADLAAVREACQGPLSKNGLAVIQTPRTILTEDVTIISVETLLCHSSGEWISEELSAIPVKTDPQGIGSCITYLRRYALSAVAGVASEDDDGNAASNGGEPQRVAAKPRLSQKATEITQLKKAAVDACTMLNDAGDSIKWSGKRLNEFSIKEFGLPADDLELEPMREMVKRLSMRLDDLKKGLKKDPVDAERQSKINQILKAPATEVERAAAALGYNQPLDAMSLDQLVAMSEEVVPF